jgi:diguanylate cyclase (GGDEF)-like protein
MSSIKHEEKRKRELLENVTILHMLCLFIMLFALVISRNLFAEHIFPFINYEAILYLALCLISFGLVNLYNRSYYNRVEEKAFNWVKISFVGYPLAIAVVTMYWIRESNIAYPEIMLLLPIIIAASIGGQILGLSMATLCGTIVLYFSYLKLGTFTYNILESQLIYLSIMFIVGWFVGTQTDSEKDHRRYLLELAQTDLLTGLYSHRYFQDQLHEYFHDSAPEKPLALILLDINYFKYYNESFGHQMGDNLLKIVAGFINEIKPENAIAARYAGGQFVILLQGYEQERVVEVAQNLLGKINDYHFFGEKHQPEGKITISCGIAIYPQHASNSKELQSYAEQALYKARSLSRQNIELYFSVFDNMEISSDEREVLNSIRTLVSVINAKDRYTYGHSERVTYYSHKMAEKMGLSEEEIRWVDYASFLHDIGKIEIDREILNKPSKLNDAEWAIIKQHPIWGSDMVKPLTKLRPIVSIIRYHHENYDGSGYPDGLSGDEIPVISRIIRIVDSFDAMTSHRPYRQNMSWDEALNEIRRHAGTLFDPTLVVYFEEILKSDSSKQVV